MVICWDDRLAVRATAKFARAYEGQGCPVGVTVDPEKKENEPWRRITGMTVGKEEYMDRKERRAGIRRLVDWVEAWVGEEVRNTKDEVRGDGRETVVEQIEGGARSPHSAPAAFASLMSALSLNSDGAPAGGEGAESWACEGQAREVVAGVCLELNISRSRLSELVRECRGISATELIDGFRVRPVKRAIAELLKQYARELWLAPGLYAGVLVMDERLKVYGGGKSEYFVDPSEDFRRREYWLEISERRVELIAAFDAGWKRAEMSRAGFAIGLGFRSFSELNRACLNVFGKSVRQIAFEMTGGVVEFYLAKEQEQLRELAVCEHGSARIARARYLYRGDCARPGGDFARVSYLWDAMAGRCRDVMERWLGDGS